MNDLHSDLDPGILFLLHVFALCIIALGISRYCKADDFSDEPDFDIMFQFEQNIFLGGGLYAVSAYYYFFASPLCHQ